MRKAKKNPQITVEGSYPYDQCDFCTHIRRDHSFDACKGCSKCTKGFVEPRDGHVLQGDARPDLTT